MVNLYRMRQLMRQVPRKLWQIEQEKAKATKITTVLTGMPRGGSGRNQVEDGAIKLTELKEAYAEVSNELHYMQVELIPLIDTLEDARLSATQSMLQTERSGGISCWPKRSFVNDTRTR